MFAHALVILGLAIAHAGVISGGGGGALVCRDANGQVTSAELLDFWEAREVSGLTLIQDNTTPVDDQFAEAVARLATIDSALAEQTVSNYAFVKSHRVKRGEKIVIDPPNDANDRIHDAKCPLAGMMFFDDDRKKLVTKEEVFTKLGSNTEVVGALFHEALYKTMRDNRLEGGKDSVLTRILVGCLFATDDLGECLNLNAISPPTDRKVWSCEIPAGGGEPGLSFSAFASDDGDWTILPTRLGPAKFGFEILGKFTKGIVTLPGMSDDGYTLDGDSMRITGLERLGLPWPASKPPYGSAHFKIVNTEPLSIQHGDSDQTYICR